MFFFFYNLQGATTSWHFLQVSSQLVALHGLKLGRDTSHRQMCLHKHMFFMSSSPPPDSGTVFKSASLLPHFTEWELHGGFGLCETKRIGGKTMPNTQWLSVVYALKSGKAECHCCSSVLPGSHKANNEATEIRLLWAAYRIAKLPQQLSYNRSQLRMLLAAWKSRAQMLNISKHDNKLHFTPSLWWSFAREVFLKDAFPKWLWNST